MVPAPLVMKRPAEAVRDHWAKKYQREKVSGSEAKEEVGKEEKMGNSDQKPGHYPSSDTANKVADDAKNNLELITCPLVESNSFTLDLSSVIGAADLCETFQFNFSIDVEFFLTMVHSKFLRARRKITFISGHEVTTGFGQFNLDEVVVKLPRYGSHHTKMMVNFHDDASVEIIISTANITKLDLGGLTQMAWRSGRLAVGDTTTDKGNRFKRDIVRYLRHYPQKIVKLADRLERYNFLDITVDLVASVPGSFTVCDDPDHETYGYGGLYKVLRRNNLLLDGNTTHKVLAQVSSIAYPMVTENYKTCSLFSHLLCPVICGDVAMIAPGRTAAETHQKHHRYTPQIVFPTVNEISRSSVGYISGLAVHFNYQSPLPVASQYKDNIRPYLYKWNSGPTGRENVTPHVKIYAVDNGDNWKLLKWVMMGSHNLSRQAWGARKGSKYVSDAKSFDILSFELGVVIAGPCPVTYGGGSGIRLPFRVPPVRYSGDDMPWSPAVGGGGLKDVNGNTFP